MGCCSCMYSLVVGCDWQGHSAVKLGGKTQANSSYGMTVLNGVGWDTLPRNSLGCRTYNGLDTATTRIQTSTVYIEHLMAQLCKVSHVSRLYVFDSVDGACGKQR